MLTLIPLTVMRQLLRTIAFHLTVKVDLCWLEVAKAGAVRMGVDKVKAIPAPKVMLRAGKSKVLKINGAVIF
jgi:hypothetical protein